MSKSSSQARIASDMDHEPMALSAAPTPKRRVQLMRPSLPDKAEAFAVFDELWETRLLSNFGRYSRLFEQRAQAYFQSERRFLAVSSCDTGLILTLRALGLEPGDEVLVPSFTFNSTVNSITWNGLKPVFCDIDPETFTLDPADAARRIGPRTKAMIGVHVFGAPCDCHALEALAKERGLKLVFDAAQAFGTRYQGEAITEFGDAGVFSFSGTKVVTSGEGGLAYFKDPAVANRFDHLRRYGFIGDYRTKWVGLNGKMSEFHSALAWLGIPGADQAVAYRNAVASLYRQRLPFLRFQHIFEGCRSTYKDVAVLVKDPDGLGAQLAAEGIETKRYFMPNHFMDPFQHLGPFDLPVTEEVYRSILCLPIHNEIARADLDYVTDALLAARG